MTTTDLTEQAELTVARALETYQAFERSKDEDARKDAEASKARIEQDIAGVRLIGQHVLGKTLWAELGGEKGEAKVWDRSIDIYLLLPGTTCWGLAFSWQGADGRVTLGEKVNTNNSQILGYGWWPRKIERVIPQPDGVHEVRAGASQSLPLLVGSVLAKALAAYHKVLKDRADNLRSELKKAIDRPGYYRPDNLLSVYTKSVDLNPDWSDDVKIELAMLYADAFVKSATFERETIERTEKRKAEEEARLVRVNEAIEKAWPVNVTLYHIRYGVEVPSSYDGPGGVYTESLWTLSPIPDEDGYYMAWRGGVPVNVHPHHLLDTTRYEVSDPYAPTTPPEVWSTQGPFYTEYSPTAGKYVVFSPFLYCALYNPADPKASILAQAEGRNEQDSSLDDEEVPF